MTIPNMLLLAIVAVSAFFAVTWINALRQRRDGAPIMPTPLHTGIGFIANFFDTLGIGSFATTTAMYRLRKLVPDELLPGTLNTGHALPTVTQALIYITIVEVDTTTLLALIIAANLGMYLGAGVVVKWPRRNIQIGMGIALLVAAGLTLMTIFNKSASGGEALGLSGGMLAVGFVGNFILGALMSLGIGLYGPCLIMIALLGMNPKAAFPIMMGSCAFLMPLGSTQYVRNEAYSIRAALGLTLGGIPAVIIAAKLVGSMNLYYVRWLVVLVVVYTALSLLHSATKAER